MRSDLTTILTTLALYIAVVVSPGPNFAYVSRLALSGATRAACGASIGFALGSLIYSVLTMTGLALLLQHVGWLARLIETAGGCYLIYLGLSNWFTNHHATPMALSPRGGLYGLRNGLLVDLSNPKAIAFFIGLYAAAIPQDTALWARATIIVCSMFIEALWYCCVTLVFASTAPRAAYRRFGKWIERAFGTMIAAFGLRLIWLRD
jgi:threonine/homoserine/homoserine lactone efflux protein